MRVDRRPRCRGRSTLGRLRSSLDYLAGRPGGRNIPGRGPRALAAACPSLDCRCRRAALGYICQSDRPISSNLQYRLHDGLRLPRSEPRCSPPSASPPRRNQRRIAVGGRAVSRRLLLLRKRGIGAALGSRDAVGHGTYDICARARCPGARPTRALLRREPPLRGLVRDSGTAPPAGLDGVLRLHRGDDRIQYTDRHRRGSSHGAPPPRRCRSVAAGPIRLQGIDGGVASAAVTRRVRASLRPGGAERGAAIHCLDAADLSVLALGAAFRISLSESTTADFRADTPGLHRTGVYSILDGATRTWPLAGV